MENYCKVYFEFNPLGELLIKWEIPKIYFELDKKYLLEVPGFKYDLPKFLSIPVPFSSKSYEVNTEIISVSNGIDLSIESAKYGNINLVLEVKNLPDELNNKINFEYKISNILNADGVYFVAVYPFRTPFDNQIHLIEIDCKFSYNIKKYFFWERYFEYPSNRKLNKTCVLKSTKKGDELKVTGTVVGSYDNTIDLHITGTRLPIFIRRDIFWLIIFGISAGVFLSPFLSEIIEFFTSNSECGEATNYNFSLFSF